MQNDTIVAQATPSGRGGVAIVRVSGPLVKNITEKLLKKNPRPRYATFSVFYDEKNEAIDEGLALFFNAPHSFTGEDVLELHCHGGVYIVDALMKRILSLGARFANPGEFSLRAFLNDKIDLLQAEAIADLIDASSEKAARSAVRSLQGEFSKKIEALVEEIIFIRTYVEAAIDFSEEEIDFLKNEELIKKLNHAVVTIKKIQQEATQGALLREGITIVIAGVPNVGKSSLLNALSEKEIAIVTDIPGTTRDVLRETIVMDGLPIHVIDTAGLRDSEDPVEKIGMERARKEISRADIILLMTDVAHEIKNIKTFFQEKISDHATILVVKNKIDLTQEVASTQTENHVTTISLSAKTKEGLDLLKQKIKNIVGLENQTEGLFSARRRHLDALIRAEKELHLAFDQLKAAHSGELIAEHLRQAQRALNEITGEFTSDDLLGRIFSSFCIGK